MNVDLLLQRKQLLHRQIKNYLLHVACPPFGYPFDNIDIDKEKDFQSYIEIKQSNISSGLLGIYPNAKTAVKPCDPASFDSRATERSLLSYASGYYATSAVADRINRVLNYSCAINLIKEKCKDAPSNVCILFPPDSIAGLMNDVTGSERAANVQFIQGEEKRFSLPNIIEMHCIGAYRPEEELLIDYGPDFELNQRLEIPCCSHCFRFGHVSDPLNGIMECTECRTLVHKRCVSVCNYSPFVCPICDKTNRFIYPQFPLLPTTQMEEAALCSVEYLHSIFTNCNDLDFYESAGDVIFLLSHIVAFGNDSSIVKHEAARVIAYLIEKFEKLNKTNAFRQLEVLVAKKLLRMPIDLSSNSIYKQILNFFRSSHCKDLLGINLINSSSKAAPYASGFCSRCQNFDTRKGSYCSTCKSSLTTLFDVDSITQHMGWVYLVLQMDPECRGIVTVEGEASMEQVLQLLPIIRTYYQPQSKLQRALFEHMVYFVTHLVFMFSDWGKCFLGAISHDYLQPEMDFLESAFLEAIDICHPELLGEIMYCLFILQSSLDCKRGQETMIALHKSHGGKGLFVSGDKSFFVRYHSSYAALLALTQFQPTQQLDLQKWSTKYSKYFSRNTMEIMQPFNQSSSTLESKSPVQELITSMLSNPGNLHSSQNFYNNPHRTIFLDANPTTLAQLFTIDRMLSEPEEYEFKKFRAAVADPSTLVYRCKNLPMKVKPKWASEILSQAEKRFRQKEQEPVYLSETSNKYLTDDFTQRQTHSFEDESLKQLNILWSDKTDFDLSRLQQIALNYFYGSQNTQAAAHIDGSPGITKLLKGRKAWVVFDWCEAVPEVLSADNILERIDPTKLSRLKSFRWFIQEQEECYIAAHTGHAIINLADSVLVNIPFVSVDVISPLLRMVANEANKLPPKIKNDYFSHKVKKALVQVMQSRLSEWNDKLVHLSPSTWQDLQQTMNNLQKDL